MEAILAVRLGAMGDVLHALPAVAALRDAFPAARIGWAVEERWTELLCASGEAFDAPRSAAQPLVDVIHAVNTSAWRSAPLACATTADLSSPWKSIAASYPQRRPRSAPAASLQVSSERGAERQAAVSRG